MAIDWDSAPDGAMALVNGRVWVKWEGTKEYCNYAGSWKVARKSWSFDKYAAEFYYTIERRPADEQPAWNGKGSPLVGTVCEMATIGVFWETVEIMFLSKSYAITKGVEGEQHWHIRDVTFRTIRTPAQVAACEREYYVTDMLCYDELGGSRKGLAYALYDAGYRRIKEAE